MVNQKTNVGILCGGRSAEHEVSLQSAKNVLDSIDTNRFGVTLLVIDKNGNWLSPDTSTQYLSEHAHFSQPVHASSKESQTVSAHNLSLAESIPLDVLSKVDVVFPILHGPHGEDGTVQGLLTLSNLPFVGAGVLGSAIGMDKDIMKRLLHDSGIPIGRFLVFREVDKISFDNIITTLGLPFFIKPANLGSSVGVNKVKDRATFDDAIRTAFKYDSKILAEEFIDGRELECAVLGNNNLEASGVGEVVPQQEFYSYDAKYIDPDGATLRIPADIPKEVSEKIRQMAIQTFRTLSCEGLARVDFFLKKDGTVLVNEINTMPGFTKISMYPQLWMAAGLSYSDLITRLVELALERHKRKRYDFDF